MPDPTTTTASSQQLAERAAAAVQRGETIHLSTFKITIGLDGRLTPADLTDLLLEAGEDVRRAAEQDAEIHRRRAAGDPTVRSPYYPDVA